MYGCGAYPVSACLVARENLAVNKSNRKPAVGCRVCRYRSAWSGADDHKINGVLSHSRSLPHIASDPVCAFGSAHTPLVHVHPLGGVGGAACGQAGAHYPCDLWQADPARRERQRPRTGSGAPARSACGRGPPCRRWVMRHVEQDVGLLGGRALGEQVDLQRHVQLHRRTRP